MVKKIRWAFFFLGLGVGIILTNILYSFNPNIEYRDYSEEEIISEARELGMVFIKDNIDISEEESETSSRMDSSLANEVEEIVLVVEAGDSLEEVANKLESLGIIEDGKGFHIYAKERGYEKKIRIGSYKLRVNMDYEKIIKLITKSF